MNSTPLHEYVIGPLALVCALAVFVAAALEAPDPPCRCMRRLRSRPPRHQRAGVDPAAYRIAVPGALWPLKRRAPRRSVLGALSRAFDPSGRRAAQGRAEPVP